MRPTFMGFESATRGLMANQKALDIVGNNLGNIGVTGYTRQRVDLVSLGVTSRYARFTSKTSTLAGQGVNVNGVSQIRDPFLDKRFREQSADVGYYNKLHEALTDIETTLNDINPSPMSDAIANFEKSFKIMQEDGLSAVNSNGILGAANTVTQALREFDNKLANVWEQQRFDLGVEVNEVNSTLKNIADMNGIIKREVFNSAKPGNEYYGPNELLDQRNVLLDKLALYADVEVKQNGNGTVTVTMGGKVVVDDESNEFMDLVTDQQNKTVSVNWQSTGKPIEIYGGSLKSAVEMLNGRGSEGAPIRGEGFDKGILYYRDKINKFATVIADTFNSAIKEYEPELLPNGDPNPHAYEFKGYKQLFTFKDSSERTAGGIGISADWQSDPEYITKNVHEKGEGKDSTKFLSSVFDSFTKKLDFGEFKGNFNDYVKFYSAATLGNQLSAATARQEASVDIANSLLDQISGISGVSQEEDGVDMMQYTKAYNSMGRLMTALDEALDVLINKTGLVGR
ncbi:MAG: flagellar hook-associated protein FlgK [Hydrogenoanaerobacterium sp.]